MPKQIVLGFQGESYPQVIMEVNEYIENKFHVDHITHQAIMLGDKRIWHYVTIIVHKIEVGY